MSVQAITFGGNVIDASPFDIPTDRIGDYNVIAEGEWGISPGGTPYFQSGGANPGDEAALCIDARDNLFLVPMVEVIR